MIGRLVSRDLFGEEDPIGKFIDIGKTVFKVVGIFKDSALARSVLKIENPV